MEKLLHLFNTLWFDRGVLSSETTKSTMPESIEAGSTGDRRLKISHVRSSSDQQLVLDLNTNALLSDADSPKSVLRLTPKLETVASGKELGMGFGEEGAVKRMKGKERVRKRRSKSLADFQMESEEDHKDSSLQRLGCGKGEGDGVCKKCGRRCGRKEKMPLRVVNVSDGLEMKNQIRFWAHSVASAVR